MSRLKWTPTAVADLQRIAEFIREHNPAREQRIIALIIDRTGQVEMHPRSDQQREIRDDGTEIRSLLVSKHYRVKYAVAPNNSVNILEVIDLRSDYEYYS